MNRRDAWLDRTEWALALGLTGFLLWLHVQNWWYAPWLWRDEISTLQIATAPTLAELWRRMEWESSPLTWPLALRGWSALGLGESALALRALALAVGVGVIASLWLALRRIAGTLPLLALLLVAANPFVLRFGDTLRAYGFGLLLATLLAIALWRLTLRVGRREVVVAALLAVASVQALYHNAVVVLALCSGCAAAWALRGRLREAMAPLALGGLAAASLLPYVGPLGRARAWNVVIRAPVDLAWLVGRLRAAVELEAPWLSLVWLGLAFAALGLCAREVARGPTAAVQPADARAQAVFFAVALLVGVVAYTAFLVQVGYPTQAWYYFSLLGLAAVLIEASLRFALRGALAWRVARIALVVVALAGVAPALWRSTPARLTNFDRLAAELEARSRPGDLVVVTPWYLGISFAHYYGGVLPWLTVPDVSDHALTRYDQIKGIMGDPDAVPQSAERVRQTLQQGGRVWLVGDLPFIAGNPVAHPPPIAPDPRLGWSELHYQVLWSRIIAHALQAHASAVEKIPIDGLGVVSPFESPPLYRFDAAPP